MKKLYAFLIFALIFSSQITTYAMKKKPRRFSRQVFRQIGTYLALGSPLAITGAGAYNYYYGNEDNYTTAPKHISSFACNNLQRQGLKVMPLIKIDPDNGDTGYSTRCNRAVFVGISNKETIIENSLALDSIVISELDGLLQLKEKKKEELSTTQAINKYLSFSLEKPNLKLSEQAKICSNKRDIIEIEKEEVANLNTIDKALDYHRFALCHEGAHIQNNDTIRKIIAPLGCIAITELSRYALKRFCKLKLNRNWVRNLGYIGGGMARGKSNTLLLKAYSRKREQAADNSIIDDPALLEAAREHFQRRADFNEKKIQILATLYGPTVASLALFYNELHSTHPTDQQRAKRFEKRLQKLDQKKHSALV